MVHYVWRLAYHSGNLRLGALMDIDQSIRYRNLLRLALEAEQKDNIPLSFDYTAQAFWLVQIEIKAAEATK